MSVIQIKRSTTNVVPASATGTNSSTAGELVYSYRSADGSGDESGTGKLYIGHADGLGAGRAANVIGGSVFMDMLDHGIASAGTATASSAVILNSASHIDTMKMTNLYIGASGSATQVTSTAAELNYVDVTAAGTAQASKAVILDSNAHTSAVKTTALHLGSSGSATAVTASAAEINKLAGLGTSQAQLEYINVTPGTATATKAMVLNAASHINTVKTAALHIGASGSETLVTATAAELNILDQVTADKDDINKLDGYTGDTPKLNYLDVTAGTATASKAMVLNAASHINTVKTAALHIGASGSETAVTSSGTELNLLTGKTLETNINSAPVGHTTLASGRAVKNYVDATRSGLDVKDSCDVATTVDVSTWTYNNGAGTLTAAGVGAVSLDGIALTLNMRVLVKDQNPTTENGIYYVSTVGTGSAILQLTRALDANEPAELTGGSFTFVEQGSSQQENGYVFTHNGDPTFGTTALTVSQFSGAGQITAGLGLTKSGNTMNANVGGSTNTTGIEIVSDELRIDTDWTGASANLTSLGTVTAGTWNATAISATKGGTALDTSSSTGVAIVTSGTWSIPTSLTVPFGGSGAASFTAKGILYGNGTSAMGVTAAGTAGEFLKSQGGGSSNPVWTNIVDGGTF